MNSSCQAAPLQRGRCAFAEEPDRSGTHARLFWDANHDCLTIEAVATRCLPGDPQAFDLADLKIPAVIFKDTLGEEMLIGRGRTAVRLSIAAGTLLNGPVRFTYKVEGRRRLAKRLLALRQWEALMRLGRVPRPLVLAAANTDRAMTLIRTLDALAVHSRTRDVAIALFGEERVARDWAHESDYLRMKTRRLIEKALRLAAGEYLALLG